MRMASCHRHCDRHHFFWNVFVRIDANATVSSGMKKKNANLGLVPCIHLIWNELVKIDAHLGMTLWHYLPHHPIWNMMVRIDATAIISFYVKKNANLGLAPCIYLIWNEQVRIDAKVGMAPFRSHCFNLKWNGQWPGSTQMPLSHLKCLKKPRSWDRHRAFTSTGMTRSGSTQLIPDGSTPILSALKYATVHLPVMFLSSLT